MDIHKKVFDDLYEYDFTACAYNILNNINYDLTDIDFNNKELRNIKLGLLQKENPAIKNILNSGMKRLVELYIKENNLIEKNIIWKQKDGFIIDKYLDLTNISMSIEYRNSISKLIKSMDNKKILILYSDNKVTTKGLVHKPLDTSFYNLLLNVNFSNRKKLLETCEFIRIKFLSSNNINWFVRESAVGELSIPLKGNELLKINKSYLSSIDINDVDKHIIYENYIYPFVQTLLICYNERERPNTWLKLPKKKT